jgi:nucleoid-associated protein YgaU
VALNIPVYQLNSRCPLLSIQGNLEFSTRVPWAQQSRPDDTFYVTQLGDTLPRLAYQLYNDVRLWWILYDTNADLLMGHPLDLPIGITLRIPSRQVVETELLDGANI